MLIRLLIMDKARAPGAPGKRGVAKTFGARRICLELAVLVLVGLQVVLGAQLKPTSITMGGKTGALESGAAAGPLLLGVKPDSGPLFDKYGVEIQFRNNAGDVILYVAVQVGLDGVRRSALSLLDGSHCHDYYHSSSSPTGRMSLSLRTWGRLRMRRV